MKRIDINKPEIRQANPYRVPEGYFGDLRSQLRDRLAEQAAAESEAAVGGVWRRISGLAGALAGFVALVTIALTGFYFTGYRAQLRELEENDPLLGYTIYAEDLELLFGTSQEAEENSILFAQAVDEYLDIYGYGYPDLSGDDEQ